MLATRSADRGQTGHQACQEGLWRVLWLYSRSCGASLLKTRLNAIGSMERLGPDPVPGTGGLSRNPRKFRLEQFPELGLVVRVVSPNRRNLSNPLKLAATLGIPQLGIRLP